MRNIKFEIGFRTHNGCSIRMKYTYSTTNGMEHCGTLPFNEILPGVWEGHLTFEHDVIHIRYGYETVQCNEVIRREWGNMPHEANFTGEHSSWEISDKWLDTPFCNYAQSGIFKTFCNKKATNKEYGKLTFTNEHPDVLLFDVPANGLEEGEKLFVIGDNPALGSWSPNGGIRMTNTAFNKWQCIIDVSLLRGNELNFKFAAYNTANGNIRWEEGANRRITISSSGEPAVRHITFEGIDFATSRLRIAGTVIPLFSLRSEKSWGIGDFGDLKRFVEWLASTGQHLLQLLPVNDTDIYGNAGDSYPYNCVSVFALHKQYADISALPKLKDGRTHAAFIRHAKRLNETSQFDYQAVNELKEKYLRQLFEEQGNEIISSDEYDKFEKEQAEWLLPYCAYRFLSAKICAGPKNWGKFSSYDDNTYTQLKKEFKDVEYEIQYHKFVQYLLYVQLKDAHDYAVSLGVALKGDIPIGVAPDGADVWNNRRLFNENGSAGAPPDAFSAEGQNWGFPTYNWEIMAQDDYAWWRKRLQYMESFFDAFRIDHILGFFRIWEIPRRFSGGLSGHFRPALPLNMEEIKKSGFYFDIKKHSCKSIADMPTDKPADLLFIPDENLPDSYHPRIMASETKCYNSLDERNRQAFDRIYEDFFYHRHTDFWFEEAMKKLTPLLHSTSMTACGEDLGMIPECVSWAMNNLQILSLEIQRMPKQFGVKFARTEEYPYLSVATPSTHDMSTLREWWNENNDDTQHFYNETLGLKGKAPEILDGKTAKSILEKHLASPSMLCMTAWQDWMSMDERLRRKDPLEERINIPSNRDHIWNYRMHITIEQLLKERAFNEEIQRMIAKSGRTLKEFRNKI